MIDLIVSTCLIVLAQPEFKRLKRNLEIGEDTLIPKCPLLEKINQLGDVDTLDQPETEDYLSR